jgi:hypothetical protein
VAVVLGIAIGTMIVTDESGRTPDATTLSSIGTKPVVVGPGQAPPSVAPGSEPNAYLGDLGAVETAAQVRSAVTVAQGHGSASPPATPTACIGVAPRALGLVVVGGYGTGTAAGLPVTVLVGVAANGNRVAVVVRAVDCSTVQRVDL